MRKSRKKIPVPKNVEPILSVLSWKLQEAFEAYGEDRDRVAAVVVEAVQSNRSATIDDIRTAWHEELVAVPNDEIIERALVLRALLGPKWHVIYLNRYMLEENDECRGEETRKECPLFGDEVWEVEDYWDRIADELAADRAREEAAAQAWNDRQQRKASKA